MVLEIPSKIMSAANKNAVQEKPIEFFQKMLHSSGIAMNETSVYAFRKLKNQEGEETYQTLAKIPEASRNRLLHYSGCSDLFVRQFVTDPSELDHSILPRYFDINGEGIRSAQQLGETIPDQGFRGLALTSRGIAIRTTHHQLAEARQRVLQADTRFTEENRSVICKVFWQAQGFPFAISHQSIIKAVGQATGCFPIPLRSFKLAGMLTWILAFQEHPKKTSFQVKFDSTVCEILLTPQQQINKNPKGSKNAKKNKHESPIFVPNNQWNRNSAAASSFQTGSVGNTNKRLDELENKVARLETQQGQLAEKVDSRFDQVASQLQQVLAAVAPQSQQPKTRINEAGTGMTPPPKAQKAS